MQKLRVVLVAGAARLSALFAATAGPPDSFACLRWFFANPPAEYRSAPLVAWKGEVTEAEIRAQMSKLSAQGIGRGFIHSRPGLITEYVSERWFALCRYAPEQARKLGMQVWTFYLADARVRSRSEPGVLSSANQRVWCQYLELTDFLDSLERGRDGTQATGAGR